MDDKDIRDKATQIRIAKALLRLADANKGDSAQLDLLHEIASAMFDNQFFFLDWLTITAYFGKLAHGEIDIDSHGNEVRTRGIDDTDLRKQIEADIATTETEMRGSK